MARTATDAFRVAEDMPPESKTTSDNGHTTKAGQCHQNRVRRRRNDPQAPGSGEEAEGTVLGGMLNAEDRP